MAADAYIRSAISQLNAALTELQGEMQGMERETHESKQKMQHDIVRIEQERNFHNAEAERQQDETQKRVIHARIDQLNRQHDDLNRQISQLDAQLNQVLQRKTQVFNQLHNLAGQLDLFMSSPDLR